MPCSFSQSGFADIDDLAFLTRDEIARRLGYSCQRSCRRALARLGVGFPPAPFRGRARGDVVKAWAAALPVSETPGAPSPLPIHQPVVSLERKRAEREAALWARINAAR